ncbi:Abhydrolase_3 domain-containing protein [Pseudozyma hubeiensis]|nr:Abhydrolase_3 domain-containing protein [Pseudozyma hubeiensis]
MSAVTFETKSSSAASSNSSLVRQKRQVDPNVLAAIKRATPPRPKILIPLLRLLLFQLYFLPTSFIAIPLYMLRCIVPRFRLNRNWSFISAVYIMVVRRVMRNLIRFGVQPIVPRKGGLRDRNTLIATVASCLNLSGPGGSVVLAKDNIKALKLNATHGRPDKVWIPPAGPEYLDGILAVKAGPNDRRKIVTDAYTGPPLLDAKWLKWSVRALWFTHKPHVVPSQPRSKNKPTRPVICYFHGGAGVTFNAGDLHMGQNLAKTFARNAGIDVFSVDYNLAPFAPAPVQLYQAVSAYLYLVDELGYAPEQIYIGGDSHGSWMTLQLERYLRSYKHILFENADSVKIPGLVLLSPWIAPEDLSFKSREGNVGQDIIDLSYEDWGVSAQGLKKLPFPLSDPWSTHSNKTPAEFAALPPCFIANGGCETLLDEGQHFANLLRKAKGLPTSTSNQRIILSPGELNCKVVHHVYPHEVHDYFTVDTEISKAAKVYKQIGTWIKFTQTLL